MFGSRIRLFRLFGIPINIDLSWLIIFALISWTMKAQFTQVIPEIDPLAAWTLGLGTALAFFLCIVLHEMGHALVARRGGLPVRSITLFLFGGVAEMEREPATAGKEFAMAIAGPAVSLVLAAGFWTLFFVGGGAGWPAEAMVTLFTLAFVNTAVLVFNLVPAFPLDGGRVLRSALWAATGSLRRATYWASLGGQAFAWLLIGVGLYHVLFLPFVEGAFIRGMWLGLIGLFLNGAARGSYQSLLIRQALEGEPIRRFMNPEPITVPPALGLREWVEDHVYRHHHKVYPVVSDGRLEGVVSTRALSDIPRAEWDRYTVGDVMHRDIAAFILGPDADALEALERMQRTGSSRLLVTENSQLLGMVSLKDLLRFLDLKLELEEEGGERPARVEQRWAGAGRREEHAMR